MDLTQLIITDIKAVEVRERSPIPIAGGEGKRGPEAFWRLLRRGVYDIIQPDPIVSGTPADMLKVRGMASASGAQVIYHHGKSGIGFMIGLHLSSCFGDSPWLEYMDDGPFWQPAGFQVGFDDVIPIDAQGYVHCPETPGLGVVWDMDWLRSIGLHR